MYIKRINIVAMLLVIGGAFIAPPPLQSQTAPSDQPGSREESGNEWKRITSVEDLCDTYPERMNFLFERLNLESNGLEEVQRKYKNGDIVAAGKALLQYYKQSEARRQVYEEPAPFTGKTVAAADSIVSDVITVQRVADTVPRKKDGRLDWDHTGPEDDMEYAWLHNRHTSVSVLLRAWIETGNPVYARHIDTYLKDWIISSWPYPGVKSSTAMWRGLEVTGRVRNWMPAFYQLLKTEYLTPATALLMLSSVPEHAHYLRNFHGQGNWLTMEMSGLATVAVFWPEFKESGEWLDYAVSEMTRSIERQVYPDGVQTELTSHYHWVALRNFSQFADIVKTGGVQLPEQYTGMLEKMWHYLAVTMRPNGYGVLNNDSDKMDNREWITDAAQRWDREDWLYIATNGSAGRRPSQGPSFLFPWAGQLVSRSDYSSGAHWSFFDLGPWGTGHQHNDKLHLSVSAFGLDFLVDSGRFAYRGSVAERFREYARGSRGHNVILIDGKGQSAGPEQAARPLSEHHYKLEKDFDYATSSFRDFEDLEGEAVHTRSLFYVRGEFWVVVDRVTTDRPRKIDALWHWHPAVSVQEEGGGVVSAGRQQGHLNIIPAGDTDWSIEFVKGRETPEVQGWYSREYNVVEPNTTTIYTTEINSDQTFVWILFPSQKTATGLKAEVMDQDSDTVKVRVSVPEKGYRNLAIPFSNSAEAALEVLPAEHE